MENKIAGLGKTHTAYKLRSPSKLGGAPLYMGFLYGVKIARLDDYMGFLYGAPPDLTVHFWAQKTQNYVSQKAQMLLQKIVTDSLPPPRFTASTTTLVSLPGRKPVLTTLARVPDPASCGQKHPPREGDGLNNFQPQKRVPDAIRQICRGLVKSH